MLPLKHGGHSAFLSKKAPLLSVPQDGTGFVTVSPLSGLIHLVPIGFPPGPCICRTELSRQTLLGPCSLSP